MIKIKWTYIISVMMLLGCENIPEYEDISNDEFAEELIKEFKNDLIPDELNCQETIDVSEWAIGTRGNYSGFEIEHKFENQDCYSYFWNTLYYFHSKTDSTFNTVSDGLWKGFLKDESEKEQFSSYRDTSIYSIADYSEYSEWHTSGIIIIVIAWRYGNMGGSFCTISHNEDEVVGSRESMIKLIKNCLVHIDKYQKNKSY